MNRTKDSSPSYGLLIIGRGKLARHLFQFLDALKVPFLNWSREDSPEKLQKHLEQCTHVALCIKDSALESFYLSDTKLQAKHCAHFSGAQNIPGIAGFHPLMSFGEKAYSLDFYKRISFVGSETPEEFRKFFPFLENPYFQIKTEDKAFYHALCVLGGNFTAILWQKFFSEMKNLGLPQEALAPYLERIQENILENPDGAVTGPLIRKDHKTIERNLQSLKGDPFQRVYESFAEMYLK